MAKNKVKPWKATAAGNTWRNKTKPQRQETHKEETRQSHSGKKRMKKKKRQSHNGKKHMKKKQDKAIVARNAWRRNKTKSKAMEMHEEGEEWSSWSLVNLQPSQCKGGKAHGEQRVWFGGGGEKT